MMETKAQKVKSYDCLWNDRLKM